MEKKMNLEYETFHVNNGNKETLRNKILKYKLTNTSTPLKRLVIKDSLQYQLCALSLRIEFIGSI